MESLSEQTELGTLLYPGEGQAPAALDLDVHGENLGEAAANAFPSSQQLGLAEGSGLASDDGGSGLPGLPNPLGPGEGALDETGQLSEARSNLEESGGAALDVATQRSLLFSRIPQKQRHFCHVCNRECPSKHKLKRHLSTHSEERPFNCHLCGRSFKWTEYLAKHMRQQHKGAALPPSLSFSSPTMTSEGTVTALSTLPHQHAEDNLTGAPLLATENHGLDMGALESSNLGSSMDTSLDASMDISMDTTSTSCIDTAVAAAGLIKTSLPESSGYVESQHTASAALALSQSQTQLPTPGPLMDPTPPSQPPSISPELVPVQPHGLTPEQTSTTDIFALSMPEHTHPLTHHPDLHTSTPGIANIHTVSTVDQTFSPSHLPLPPAVVSLSNSVPHPPVNPSLPPYSMDLMVSQPAGSLAIATPSDLANAMPMYSEAHTNIDLHPQIMTSHNAFGIEMQPPPSSAYGLPTNLVPGALLSAPPVLQPVIEEPSPSDNVVPSTTANFPPPLPSPPQQPATTPPPPITIVREEPPAKRRKKETVSVGIQCEVGHETLIALFEEEEQARTQGVFPQTDLEINPSALDIPHSRDKPVILHGTAHRVEMGVVEEGGREGETSYGEEASEVSESEPLLSPSLAADRVIHKYPCEHSRCAKAYVHRKDLIRHMKIRHGLSPQRLEPIAMETPEKPFLCPVGGCTRSYFHMKDLRRHQRQCHQVSMSAAEISEHNLGGDGEGRTMVRFPCDFPGCLRSYVHKKDLVRHKRLYHKDGTAKPSVPVPLRYTDAELKKIKQEEKLQRTANSHLDESAFEKPRLDSIGSTVSNSGTDDPPNSATLRESEEASDLPSSLSIARLERLATSAVEEFHNPDSFITTSAANPLPIGGTVQSSQYGPAATHPGMLSSTKTGVTLMQEDHQTAIDHSQLSSSLQQLTDEEQGAISAMDPGYSMDSFGGGATNDAPICSYAEQEKSSMAGQQMQVVDSAPSSQYDPTSVLRSLAQAGAGDASGTPLHASIQNVVNQLLAGASGAEDMSHGAF